MGLFSSRSSSTSVTEQYQTTNSLNSDLTGINTDGAVISGSENVIYDYFPDSVAGAFTSLIDLTGEGLKSLEDTSERSLAAVIEANQQANNQDFNAVSDITKKIVPIVMIAAGAYALVKIVPYLKG